MILESGSPRRFVRGRAKRKVCHVPEPANLHDNSALRVPGRIAVLFCIMKRKRFDE